MFDPLQSDGSHRLARGLALIFDMDGVIIDSNPLHREAWAAFNLRYGLETTDEMQRRMYGRRNDQIVRDFFGDGLSRDEVFARGAAKEMLYREMAAERLESMLVPGIKNFLDRFAEAPKALATNGEPENVDLVLDGAGLRRFFQATVNGQQVKHPKPHPEIYLRAAELLNTRPANCIVFEDSHSGVQAANAAGMRVIGLSTTHGDLPGTCLVVDNFLNRELTGWLGVQSHVV